MPTEPTPAAIFDRIRALLDLLKQIRDWFPAITLSDLLEIASAARRLLPLPDLADEAGCRTWCQYLVATLDEVADLTSIELDDTISEKLGEAIEDDATWALFWSVVEWTASGMLSSPPRGSELAAKWNIDWAQLAALIQALIDFINSWKEKP